MGGAWEANQRRTSFTLEKIAAQRKRHLRWTRLQTSNRPVRTNRVSILGFRTHFCLLGLSILYAFGGLSAQTSAWQPSPGHTQVAIWPGAAPDALPLAGPEYATAVTREPVAGKPWVEVGRVSRPTMTVYSPNGKNTGAAVVVFPGGGYQILAIDLEGTEVCDWLTSQGDHVRAVEVPRAGRGRVFEIGAIPEIGAVPGIANGIGRCAEDGGAGALSRRGVAYRSAQDWRAWFFGGRASGGGDQHAFRAAFVPGCRCGRQRKLPPGFCGGYLSRDICRSPRRNGMPIREQEVRGSSCGECR